MSPGFDPLKAQVGPEEYFVLSRIDGSQSLRDVLLATGLPPERCVAIVTKLRSIGALLLPNEAAPAAAKPARAATSPGTATARTTSPSGGSPPLSRAASAPPVRAQPAREAPKMGSGLRASASSRPEAAEVRIETPDPVIDISLPEPTQAELAALVEDIQLDDTERRRVLALARLADGREPYKLLGVPSGSEPMTLKRAYFKLSKEIHPDRFYGKRLGSFGPRMAVVFEAVSRAYAKLTNPDRARASGAHQAVATNDQPQSQQEYAAELFERACSVEVGGEVLDAMKLFAAAVRIDPQAKYLRRATSCALRANQPKTALEYAKKAQTLAPNDPSAMRLLATAFRAVGKLDDAEELLVMAMAIKSENDVLSVELRNDLAEVRRQLKTGA
ncbi:MAG: heat shock protein DnaJ domain protein [Myxococcales bacterium]|nr:heat shock protein DnaJ domain protein [Myxococcales bacterium]